MSSRWKKIAIGALIAVLALGYLFWSGLSTAMVTTRTVGEFLDSPEGRSRVTGSVQVGSVRRLEDGSLSFVLEEEGREVPVLFRDTVPDMFAEGRPVIVEGSLQADGVLKADTLLTKCPSKYEGVEGEHPEEIDTGGGYSTGAPMDTPASDG